MSELQFRLLEELARHVGRAKSYGDLSDAVWDAPHYGDTSALRSLVKRFRRKVGPSATGATIQSVRRFGFRLVEAR